MTDNNKHLVRVGHEFAAAMSDDTPIITIAKMVTELASALDVQSARSDALAAENAYLMPKAASELSNAWVLHKYLIGIQAAIMYLDNGNKKDAQEWLYGTIAGPGFDFPDEIEDIDAWAIKQLRGSISHTQALEIIKAETPATDAWVNEQRDAILDATFEAAKQEVERRFGRTFQDCAWLARRNSDTQMKGAVEMAEWVELYAAQLRGSQV